MKIIVGILSILSVLALGTLAVLAVWNIYPVSWVTVWKTGVSILLISTVVTLVWLFIEVFLKKDKYQDNGNKAHRIK